MADIPTDAEIRSKMEALLKTVDLNSLSIKQFIATLSEKFGGADLRSKKKFIKSSITEILDAMGGDEEEDDGGDSSNSSEVEAPKKKGGGLSAIKEISPQLSAFLGCGKEAARTDVVKGMWDYIREHNLQDPNDKRQIILDDKMKEVFGKDVESFSMFTMNKYISPHIHPFKPLDLTPTTRKRKAEDGGSGKKKKKEQKKKAPGMQAPYRLSDDLVAVVGKSILPRPQVTQALWKYIRENDLQVGSELDRSLIATLFIARFILTLQHVSRSSFLPSLRTPKTNERSCAMKNSSVSLEGIQVLPCFQ